jgi:hypothetical protein
MIDWENIKIQSFDDLLNLPSDYLEILEEDKPAMADTIGSLIDKLGIINLKMFWNQETLYEMRRMTKDEFVSKYGQRLDEVHDILKRCCDMNVLRSQLIEEIDQRVIKVGEKAGLSEEAINELRLSARPYKTY